LGRSFIAFVFYALSLIFPYPSLYNVLASVSFLDAFALKEEALFKKNCPHCYSEKVKIHSHYQTKGNGERKMFICQECSSCFAETYGSVIAGLETPLSEIVKVLKARMEGIRLNAEARVFGYAKTTILNWEKKLSGLQETLFLYALVTGQ
jgi:transposase-like protein